MGISDDIRPKKNKITENEEGKEDLPEDLDIDGGELVSIKRGHSHDFVDEDIEDQLRNEATPEGQEDLSNYFYQPNTKKGPEDSDNPRKTRTFGKWLIVILIIALIAIIAWQNQDSLKSYFGIQKNTSNGNSDNSSLYSNFSVSGTSASNTPTTDITSTPATTPATSTQAPTTTAPSKSTYSISVLNGNGIKGSAAAVNSKIANAGYTVGNTGNALKFTYADTIIYYKTGDSAVASDIKSLLSDRTCELTEDNTIAGKYDIVVVVGKT